MYWLILQVTAKVRELPQTLTNLIDYTLQCVESEFGAEVTGGMMSLLYCLPSGV